MLFIGLVDDKNKSVTSLAKILQLPSYNVIECSKKTMLKTSLYPSRYSKGRPKLTTHQMYYTKQLQSDGKFLIVDGLNQVIQTHCATPFWPLSGQTADLLCNDLNEIHSRNVLKRQLAQKDKAEPDSAESWTFELMQSFSYCILSTVMESVKRNDFAYPVFDLNYAIQWDMLFRLNPQPARFQEQLTLIESMKPLLTSEWVDLPLNYAYSLSEMEDNEVGFVPDNIIDELQEVIGSFSWTEYFIVEILFQFTARFSITTILFWVSGKIDSDMFFDLYRVFFEYQPLDMTDEEQIALYAFYVSRLDYLRKTNISVTQHDGELVVKK